MKNSYNLQDVKTIVEGYCEGFLKNEKETTNLCFLLSASLQGYLDFCRIPCKLTEGELEIEGNIYHHYWLTLSDGTIVDGTADQFEYLLKKDMPRLYIGIKPEWYKEKEV
jgi:hypothetical protein